MKNINEIKLNEIFDKLSKNELVKVVDVTFKEVHGKIAFHMFLANTKRYNKELTGKINKNTIDILDKVYPGVYYKMSLIEKDIVHTILSGNLVLYIGTSLYRIICQSDLNRSISDSIIEPQKIYSSRDGLTESIETNVSLIQKRIKSTGFMCEQYLIGERSNTLVDILYIDDIANKDNVKIVREKLETLNTATIYSINDIIYLFEKNSLFPLTAELGSPEIIAGCINEGQICILIDQIPIAIVVPVNIFYYMTLKEGNYSNPVKTIYNRMLIFICFFVSIGLLGIYSGILSFHSSSLSLISISAIKTSLKGSTFPLFLEFIFITFVFDLLKLAASKSPKMNLQNLIITVGGLLIGQNAVNSGFISSFNLLISAISYISSYAITKNQRFIDALSIVRLIIFLCGMVFGLFGVLIAIIFTFFELSNLKSLNTPYLAPITPFIKKDFIEIFFGKRLFKRKKRNLSYDPLDKSKGDD